MSTIICLKHGDRLVLGTDSRRMNSDLSAVESNTVEKLFELRPGTFLAQMGRRLATDRELEAARDLARTTPDIRDLAGALERELRPTLAQMTEILSRAPRGNREIAAALAGEIPIHRFVLAGRSRGELGWVHSNFYLDGGRIVRSGGEYFGQSRRIYATDGAAVQGIMRERRTFTDDPVTVVRRLLAAMRRADRCVGGADQIVSVNGDDVCWVSRLEAERERGGFLPTLKHAAAVLAAGLFLVMPASAIRAEDAVFATGAIGSADIGNAQINNLHFDRASGNKIQIRNADIDRVTANKLVVTSADIQSLDVSKLTAGTAAFKGNVIFDGQSYGITIDLKAATLNLDANSGINLSGSALTLDSSSTLSVSGGSSVSIAGSSVSLQGSSILLEDGDVEIDTGDLTITTGQIWVGGAGYTIVTPTAVNAGSILHPGTLRANGGGPSGSGSIEVDGSQVVGPQLAAVASPSADVASLKTAVDAIINRLATHGLIAT